MCDREAAHQNLQLLGHSARKDQARTVAELHVVGEEDRLEVLGVAGRSRYADHDLADDRVENRTLANVRMAHAADGQHAFVQWLEFVVVVVLLFDLHRIAGVLLRLTLNLHLRLAFGSTRFLADLVLQILQSLLGLSVQLLALGLVSSCQAFVGPSVGHVVLDPFAFRLLLFGGHRRLDLLLLLLIGSGQIELDFLLPVADVDATADHLLAGLVQMANTLGGHVELAEALALRLAAVFGAHSGVRGERQYADVREARSPVVHPGDHEFGRDQVALVENENDLLVQFLFDVVVQGDREMENGVANVGDQQNDVGHLQRSPQLTPGLQVHLEVAEVAERAVVLLQISQVVLEIQMLVGQQLLLGQALRPFRSLREGQRFFQCGCIGFVLDLQILFAQALVLLGGLRLHSSHLLVALLEELQRVPVHVLVRVVRLGVQLVDVLRVELELLD